MVPLNIAISIFAGLNLKGYTSVRSSYLTPTDVSHVMLGKKLSNVMLHFFQVQR